MNAEGFVTETEQALGMLCPRYAWVRHDFASALLACSVVIAGGAAAQPGPPQERPHQREQTYRPQDWRSQPAHEGQEQRVPPRRLTPEERRALMHDLRDVERDIYRQRRGRE